MATLTISKEQYDSIKDNLKTELIEKLEEEVEFAEFETENEGLWNTPGVDSKAVVKLSPTIEKYTGAPLDITWIQNKFIIISKFYFTCLCIIYCFF